MKKINNSKKNLQRNISNIKAKIDTNQTKKIELIEKCVV